MSLNITGNAVLFAFCSLALIGSAMPEQKNAPVAGTITLGVDIGKIEIIAKDGWRASKLLRASVYNDSDQKIGKIGDLIVAPDGTLSVAIIDVGGFLGMGKHHVAIPVQQFTQVTPKIVLPGATKDILKQMPEFKYNKG